MLLISQTSGRIQLSGLLALVGDVQCQQDTHLAYCSVDLSCYDLPKVGFGFMKHPGSFYLRVSIDSRVERTLKAERSNSPKWDNVFYLFFIPFDISIISPKLILFIKRYKRDG
jgi:hypothetical protein